MEYAELREFKKMMIESWAKYYRISLDEAIQIWRDIN